MKETSRGYYVIFIFLVIVLGMTFMVSVFQEKWGSPVGAAVLPVSVEECLGQCGECNEGCYESCCAGFEQVVDCEKKADRVCKLVR